jgi:hypothetical protein
LIKKSLPEYRELTESQPTKAGQNSSKKVPTAEVGLKTELPAWSEIYVVRDNLEEVLETLYSEAVIHLRSKPNPYSLGMMLYHFSKYHSGTAMERFWRTIKFLRELDPVVTRYADFLINKGQGG